MFSIYMYMDNNQFEIFYRKRYNYFRNLFYVYFHHYSDDILQEAFVLLYNNLDKFDPEKSDINTYFFTIVKNLYFKKLKKDKRLPFVNIEDVIIREQWEEEDEDLDFINRLLNNIPEYYKNILIDYYYCDDMTYKSLSEKYDVEVHTVRNHIYKGRQLLKKEILKMEKNDIF